MKIDLCKIFGVEEGEEFKIGTHENPYRIYNNSLQHFSTNTERWNESCISFNYVTSSKITKLPKKKQFTDDELCVLRNIDKEYKWIARDKDDYCICAYGFKPSKMSRSWVNGGESAFLDGFSHLFQSIQWEDEEPVFIDDYVERGVQNAK